jgi:RNA polymerase sigma-70 factor, ECF subfamily
MELGAIATREPTEAEVIEALYERHHAEVYRLALRYGGGRVAWAEDVTQDVFVSLIGAVHRLREVEDLGGWFYRVTTRRCMTRISRERFRALAPVRWFFGNDPPEVERPDETLAKRSELFAALGALDALPPKERVAFAMHHLDGKELKEIGQVLGHSKGYVSKLIKRAEERLGRISS